MSDLLLIFSEKDRERVKSIETALSKYEYQIRNNSLKENQKIDSQKLKQQIERARVSIIFWSMNTLTIKDLYTTNDYLNKQTSHIHVMLDNLRSTQIPETITLKQCMKLTSENFIENNPEWRKLLNKINEQATPLWMEDQLTLKNKEIDQSKSDHQSTLEQCEQLKQLLQKEIESHNQFRQSRANIFAEAENAKQQVERLKTSLHEQQEKSKTISQELKTHKAKIHSNTTLLGSIALALATGAIGLYLITTMPLKHKLVSLTETLNQLAGEQKETQANLSALQSNLKEKNQHTSELASRLSLLKQQKKSLQKETQRLSQANKIAKEQMTLQAHELSSTNSELQTTKKFKAKLEQETAKYNETLKATRIQLVETKSKLNQAEIKIKKHNEEIKTFKQNAYREIANIKNNAAREVSALRRRINQLQAQKNKQPKPQ